MCKENKSIFMITFRGNFFTTIHEMPIIQDFSIAHQVSSLTQLMTQLSWKYTFRL